MFSEFPHDETKIDFLRLTERRPANKRRINYHNFLIVIRFINFPTAARHRLE